VAGGLDGPPLRQREEDSLTQAMGAGAVGAVSAVAAAHEVATVVAAPSADGTLRLGELRAAVEQFPR
jgi:hypothetical protein